MPDNEVIEGLLSKFDDYSKLKKRKKTMFTSKQRSNLKSLASAIEPIAQIGKGGVTDNMTESLTQALEKRELIKISVLNNAEDTADMLAEEVAEKTGAEVVCVIGKKIVLYKKSTRKDFKHIEF